MPNQGANLTSYKPGKSGNPSGVRKTAKFRKSLERVYLKKVALDTHKQISRMDNLLLKMYDRAIELIPDADIEEIMSITPLLRLIKESFDGKDIGAHNSIQTKEQKVILIGGKIDHEEEVHTQSESVVLELREEGDPLLLPEGDKDND
jgi:hypothetical protein